MFLIVGLGNPGPEYHHTRHNAGFDLLDLLADEYGIDINKNKYKAMVGEGIIEGKKAILLKPMTYMNLSGQSVVEAVNFYKPREEEFIVIYDDISLQPGSIRIRKKGSAGGHNGIKNIIALTGTDLFQRIKIGVGAPRGNLVTHVLGKFKGEEEEAYIEGLKIAKEAIITILKEGIDTAMNRYNSTGKKIKEKELKEKELKEKEVKEESTGVKNEA